MCHYASDKSCTDFSLKCKSVWRPALPGPAGELTALPRHPGWIKGVGIETREVDGENTGRGQLREGDKGRRRGMGGEK